MPNHNVCAKCGETLLGVKVGHDLFSDLLNIHKNHKNWSRCWTFGSNPCDMRVLSIADHCKLNEL